MAYVAVKGGEQAIANAHAWLDERRRGDDQIAELSIDQIKSQMSLAVDRVMGEGSCYDRDLAALAIKQAMGDLHEAIFLLRAYRTTLPRFGSASPIETENMDVQRRISAAFKDLPGGQILGPTFDYTHRLLDFKLAAEGETPAPAEQSETPLQHPLPTIAGIMQSDDLLEPAETEHKDKPPFDLTRQPASFPADRDQRLQALARGDEGFLLGVAYSTQRGFGSTHPLCGEIRMGEVAVEFTPEELGFPIELTDLEVTECQMVSTGHSTADTPPRFTRGYGLVFGHSERKAMSMAIVDRALRARELGKTPAYPAEDEEFILYHCDSLESSGFVQHLKLPHYVDFQADLQNLRKARARWEAARATVKESEKDINTTAGSQ